MRSVQSCRAFVLVTLLSACPVPALPSGTYLRRVAGPTRFAWLPSNRLMLFPSTVDALYVTNWDGSDKHKLLTFPARHSCVAGPLSPSGELAVLVVAPPAGPRSVEIRRVRDAEVVCHGLTPAATDLEIDDRPPMAWSPDGTRLAWLESHPERPTVGRARAPEAVCIGSVQTGRVQPHPLDLSDPVTDLLWHPEGKSLLLVVNSALLQVPAASPGTAAKVLIPLLTGYVGDWDEARKQGPWFGTTRLLPGGERFFLDSAMTEDGECVVPAGCFEFGGHRLEPYLPTELNAPPYWLAWHSSSGAEVVLARQDEKEPDLAVVLLRGRIGEPLTSFAALGQVAGRHYDLRLSLDGTELAFAEW